MVSGCVGFVRKFSPTIGPSRSGTVPFVCKVSSFFQAVNRPGDAASSRAVERLPTLPDQPRDRTQSTLLASVRPGDAWRSRILRVISTARMLARLRLAASSRALDIRHRVASIRRLESRSPLGGKSSNVKSGSGSV
jgi:hypothetical protein